MTADLKIGIIGGGAVGKAIAAYYPKVKIYDKYKTQDSIAAVASQDYIFVAVPTPFANGPDLREMDDAMANIAAHLTSPENQIIIIKSTTAPGTTDDYQAKYPRVNFLFNPEFLTEKVAAQDFAFPDKQIVGYTTKTKDLAPQVLEILPDAAYKKILPAKSAEMAKYAVNAYYAFKVVFSNQIYDIAQAAGADYDLVRQGLAADRRIIDSHFDVWAGGYRGYDGKCLPKDIKTLVWLGQKKGVDVKFLEQIIKINGQLKDSKKNE